MTILSLAYIGPGAGISLIGALLALIGSVAFAVLMMAAYPLRMFFKRRAARVAAGHGSTMGPRC